MRDHASPEPSPVAPDRLNGWKEIASYLGKSVRTAERWERDYGLPVHRLEPAGGEVVFAVKAEIDQWMLTSHARAAAGDASQASVHDTPPPAPAAVGVATVASADVVTAPPAPVAGEVPGPPPAALRRRPRHRLWLAALAGLALAAVSAAWWWTGRAPALDAPDIALSWRRASESRVPRKLESGLVVDPAYVEVRGRDLLFHYEKQTSRWQGAPYAFARLPMPLLSPSVSFRLRPKADGRLALAAGVMDAASGFLVEGPEALKWGTRGLPVDGVAILVTRTAAQYAASGVNILVFAGGAVSESNDKEAGLLFEPGRSYNLSLSVESGLATATASDGVQVETVTLRPKVPPARLDQVFAADAGGVSNSASPGHYVLALEGIGVEELVHPVRFDVLPDTIRADGSATALDRVPLAFYSTPAVDATDITAATVSLSGVGLLRDPAGRYDCRQRDVNGDGLRDLVCHVDGRALLGGPVEKVVSLEGRTTSGRVIRGQQFIRLRP